MKSARLPFYIRVLTVTMLFQSAVLAADHPLTETTMPEDSSRLSGQTHVDCSHHSLSADHTEEGYPQHGRSLPVLDIQAGGEVSLNDNSVIEKPWTSKAFECKGRVQLVQYIAANRGALSQNKQFTKAMLEKQFSSEQMDTTIIVHMADTLSLAKGIVVSKIAKNKEKHESVNFVIDEDGVGLQRWGMKHKSFAIIVLDADGKVLFAKDGPLSEMEIESTIKLIERQMS